MQDASTSTSDEQQEVNPINCPSEEGNAEGKENSEDEWVGDKQAVEEETEEAEDWRYSYKAWQCKILGGWYGFSTASADSVFSLI